MPLFRTIVAATAIALAFSADILAKPPIESDSSSRVIADTGKPLRRGSTVPLEPTTRQRNTKTTPSKQSTIPCTITNAGSQNTRGWPALLRYAQDWTQARPQEAEAWFVLGIAHDKTGHTAKAIEAYKRAIHIKPGATKAPFRLGIDYVRSNQAPEAIKVLKQALYINPKDPEYWFALGLAYAVTDQPTKAVEALRQVESAARQAGSFTPEKWFSLGVFYAPSNQTAKVEKALTKALHFSEDRKSAYGLGRWWARSLRREAIKAIQQVLRDRPEDPQLLYILGVANTSNATGLRDVGKIREIYGRLKELDPALACQFFNNVLLP